MSISLEHLGYSLFCGKYYRQIVDPSVFEENAFQMLRTTRLQLPRYQSFDGPRLLFLISRRIGQRLNDFLQDRLAVYWVATLRGIKPGCHRYQSYRGGRASRAQDGNHLTFVPCLKKNADIAIPGIAAHIPRPMNHNPTNISFTNLLCVRMDDDSFTILASRRSSASMSIECGRIFSRGRTSI